MKLTILAPPKLTYADIMHGTLFLRKGDPGTVWVKINAVQARELESTIVRTFEATHPVRRVRVKELTLEVDD